MRSASPDGVPPAAARRNCTARTSERNYLARGATVRDGRRSTKPTAPCSRTPERAGLGRCSWPFGHEQGRRRSRPGYHEFAVSPSRAARARPAGCRIVAPVDGYRPPGQTSGRRGRFHASCRAAVTDRPRTTATEVPRRARRRDVHRGSGIQLCTHSRRRAFPHLRAEEVEPRPRRCGAHAAKRREAPREGNAVVVFRVVRDAADGALRQGDVCERERDRPARRTGCRSGRIDRHRSWGESTSKHGIVTAPPTSNTDASEARASAS